MATRVSMPQLGETVTEGTILRWAKSVGDSISEDEALVEISTDKVDTEVPSPVSGVVLEILVDEGETVEVGTDLVVIGEEGEEPEAAPAEEAPPREEEAPTEEAPTEQAEAPAPEQPAEEEPAAEEQAEEPQPQVAAPSQNQALEEEATAEAEVGGAEGGPSPDGEPRLLSPVVRKLARENDIDLNRVEGTGQGGRITRRDVEAYIASGPAGEEAAPAQPEAPEQPAPQEAPAPPKERPAEAQPQPQPQEPTPPPAAAPARAEAEEGAEEVELSRLRVRIAQNMHQSKQTAAHVWTAVEVDYERVERVRQAHKAAFKEEEGFSLTYLPFIARATIDALKAYPVVNSSFFLEERKSVRHRTVNLGVAIDLDQQGLVVASLRDSDGLRMVGLARGISELANKARAGKLDPDDVTGATFTITNPGPFGSFMSAPIINVPNVGILSTDTISKRAAVVTGPDGEDMIAIRHIGYLGLTWDHRAFDGSTAVLFLQRIKHNIETWDWEQELA